MKGGKEMDKETAPQTTDIFSVMKRMKSEVCISDTTLTEDRLDTINKIMDSAFGQATTSSWESFLDTNDPCVWCGILLSPSAPDRVKIQAIEKASLIKDPNSRFFLPILFAEKELGLVFMSESVSEKFVEKISYGNFLNKLRLYLKKTDSNKLPFSNTHIEDMLIKKLLLNYNKKLSSAQRNSFFSYKILELYRNEDKLKKFLGDLSQHNEFVRTAIVNNPYLSTEIKREAFLIGCDISQITTPQEPDIVMDIYMSAMDSLEAESPSKSLAIGCICNLIKHNLLPESCELDFIKKYINGEIDYFATTVRLMLRNTKYDSVLKEVIEKKPIPELMAEVVLNKNTPNGVAITAVKNINTKFYNTEQYKKLEPLLLNIAQTAELPEDLCEKIVKCSRDKKELVIGTLCTNSRTPVSFLEKVIDDEAQPIITRTIALFNLKSKDAFTRHDAQIFLNTVCAIAEIHSLEPSKHLELSPIKEQFLPNYLEESNNKLRTILQDVINDTSLHTPCGMYANFYLQVLNKKDLYQKVKENPFTEIDKMSNEELVVTKKQILNAIFYTRPQDIDIYDREIPVRCTSGTNLDNTQNFYDIYTVLEQIDSYAPLYEDIINEIEKRKNLENNKENIETTER